MSDDHAFALSYRNGAEYFYIPTVPPANKWRGPFASEILMRRALCDELGHDVTERRTIIPPTFLQGE